MHSFSPRHRDLLLFAILIATWAAWHPRLARADADIRVLVMAAEPEQELAARRVRAELSSAGFALSPSHVDVDAPEATDALAERAEAEGVAAIVLVASREQVFRLSVVVVDPVSGKHHFRRIDRSVPREVEAVGLQAVELLHAALLEAGLESDRGSAAETAALREPPQATATVEPSPFVLAIDAGAAYTPGPVATSASLGARALARVGRYASLGLRVRGTPGAARIHDAGSARVGHGTVMATLALWPERPRHGLVAYGAVSAGALMLWGGQNSSFEAARGAACAAIDLGLRISLSKQVSLLPSLEALGLAGAAHIRSNDERIARFGPVVVTGSLGLVWWRR